MNTIPGVPYDLAAGDFAASRQPGHEQPSSSSVGSESESESGSKFNSDFFQNQPVRVLKSVLSGIRDISEG